MCARNAGVRWLESKSDLRDFLEFADGLIMLAVVLEILLFLLYFGASIILIMFFVIISCYAICRLIARAMISTRHKKIEKEFAEWKVRQ